MSYFALKLNQTHEKPNYKIAFSNFFSLTFNKLCKHNLSNSNTNQVSQNS